MGNLIQEPMDPKDFTMHPSEFYAVNPNLPLNKGSIKEKISLKAFRIHDLFDTKNADEVEALMRNGGDAKALNFQGDSPLFYYNNYEHAAALLKAGVNATVKNKEGNTALHGVRDEKTAEALMNAGCSYKELNNKKETPLMSIMKNNNAQPEVINKLAAMDYSDLPADVRAKQDEMLKQYAATHSHITLDSKETQKNGENTAHSSTLKKTLGQCASTIDVTRLEEYGENIQKIGGIER